VVAMKFFPSMILLFSFVLFAQVATQTEWGGGPGVTGPVIDFEDTFMSSSMIDYLSIPGRISLSPEVPNNLESDRLDYLHLAVYPDSGFLESSIMDIHLSWIPWNYLYFSTILPQSTSIGIQVRVSYDYNEMGPWSEIFMSPGSLQGVLEESANYVQYRAVLFTANPDTTPTLKDVSISYAMGGIAGSCSPVSHASLHFATNPAVGPVEAVISLISTASVEILVFDLSGRLAKEVGIIDYESGRHTVMLGEFSPGIYNILMRWGESSSFHRFVVVK